MALAHYWAGGRLRELPRHLFFRVLQRSAIDALRSRLRRERRRGTGDPAFTLRPTRGALERALRRLRQEDAALVVMQAVMGMSYEELATVERSSINAIRSRLFRIRRRLAQLYDEEGGER